MSALRDKSPSRLVDATPPEDASPAPVRSSRKLSNGKSQRGTSSSSPARTKQHLTKLPSQNIAVCVPGFARRQSASPLDLAVVRAIEGMAKKQRHDRRHISTTSKMLPARPVVVVVSLDSRAKLILQLLQANSKERVVFAPSPGIESLPGKKKGSSKVPFVEKFFDSHDIVIVRDWWAVDQLQTGRLSMLRIGLLLFDGAEAARSPAHVFAAIMRESYICLPMPQRPRVFAISVVAQSAFDTPPVEAHLCVEFPRSDDKPQWKATSHFESLDHRPICVETVRYKKYATKEAERLHSDIPDMEKLKNELGFLAVTCYQNLFDHRAIASLDGYRSRSFTSNTMIDDGALTGLTEKSMSLLHILQEAFAANASEDGLAENNDLMAVVHAGPAVIAVGLHALISDLPAFKAMGMISKVVIGDPDSAKPLDRGFADEDTRGLQGQETDDEAVDEFGVADANVLLVASDNMDAIERTRRSIPPAPLVIRFDGTLCDPDKDSGGGHCRVVIFEGESSRRRDDPHRSRRKKHRRAIAVSGSLLKKHSSVTPDGLDGAPDLEVGSADESPLTPNGEKAGRLAPTVPTSPTNPTELRASIPSTRDCALSSKKRNLPRNSPADAKKARVTFQKDAGAAQDDDEELLARTVSVANALVGPRLDVDDEYFLYGFRLQERRDHFTIGAEDREIENWGGLENFGVVLSEKLGDDDLNISLGDLGLQCAVDKDVGTLGLVFIGSIRLSSEQVVQAREYMMALFSSILDEVDRNSFNWDVFDKEDKTDTPKKAIYYRQYLVVPIDRSDGIVWDDVSRMLRFSSNSSEENEAGASPCPERGEAFRRHLRSLEYNLLYVMSGPRIVFGSELRHDQSPLSYIVRSKKFALDDVGSFLPDDDIPCLINTVEDSDPEGLAEKCPFLVSNSKTSSHTAEFGGKMPKASVEGPKKQFSPYRNRLKKRKAWVGSFLQTHEDFQRTRNLQLQHLDQPLITTSAPPTISMENFIDTIRRHLSMREVLETMSRSDVRTRSLVPELCRVHPIPVGALFLPACLLGMERHILLCELRQIFASKIDTSLRLKVLSQALTSHGVNPEENYERLEFLGDAVLKYSCTLRIFTKHPHYNEGRMHVARAKIIANDALRDKSLRHDLQKFLCFSREVVNAWRPPGYSLEGRFVRLKQKSLADVVEALCGVLYLCGSEHFQLQQQRVVDLTDSAENLPALPTRENINPTVQAVDAIVEGYKTGVAMLEEFNILDGKEPTHRETLLSTIHSLHPRNSAPPTEIIPEAFPRDPRLASPVKTWDEEFGPVEAILGYKFKRRHLLLCALTHGSYIDHTFESTTMAETFQRLEFLGDAVVDFIVVLYLYDQYPQLGPGPLTELKGRVVSNESFARVSIQFGLTKYLFMESPSLKDQITRFEKSIHEEIRAGGDAIFDEEGVGSCAAPKVLGDVFESILGAILVDSGFEAVWNVSMKLLKYTLERRANPANPVMYPTMRLHHVAHMELQITSQMPDYVTVKVKDKDRYECTVKIVGFPLATARATTLKRAQLLAARAGLGRLQNAGVPGTEDETLVTDLREKATKIKAQVRRHYRS